MKTNSEKMEAFEKLMRLKKRIIRDLHRKPFSSKI